MILLGVVPQLTQNTQINFWVSVAVLVLCFFGMILTSIVCNQNRREWYQKRNEITQKHYYLVNKDFIVSVFVMVLSFLFFILMFVTFAAHLMN
ncbi:hypothetical protein FGL85_05940 [Leuconostoc pseudomesenteroides]|uniref:Uncharacterized protein n=1 Tax=Leuconostoc pseudomesenteroides TaxID=33968 RepID=A0A5B8T2M1_LEUPS|nr:hypothetical protein [Leuconostoc pseudomesenteroides]QEA42065.1 hypothetical protein FGL85_05940 [Leuconostoc pseudomesenteroides]